MTRSLLLLSLVAVLASLATGGGCVVRGPSAAELEHGGSLGAAIAAMLAGPAAAPIGAAIGVVITGLGALVVRSGERGHLVEKHADEKVAMTDKFAQALAGIATTQTFRASASALEKTAAPTPHQEPPP